MERQKLSVQVSGCDAAIEVASGSCPLEIAPACEGGFGWVAARVNNDIVGLRAPILVDSELEFLTMADPHGWRVYRRSLCFLAAKAVRDCFPHGSLVVEHSMGLGIYCSYHDGGETLTASMVARVEARMRELVAADLQISRCRAGYQEAIESLETAGKSETLNLLRFRNPPHIVLYCCEGFFSLDHGPLVASTGVLNRFELVPYGSGMVIHLPPHEEPCEVPVFEPQPQLFQVFREHKEWGRILEVPCVGRLNEIAMEGGSDEFIMTAEALHEKKLAVIAHQITQRRDSVRVVLVAGPSSSGKTTFAKRLAVHLRVNGLRPVTLGTDDYFVGDNKNPIGEDGKPDYEHIEAVDLPLFNRDLRELTEGREIEIPRFNFETKRREYRGEKLKIAADQILIIEGIHGLNPRLTEMIPAEHKFKIYISALTQLRLDSLERISTTDNRLVRRLVRDFKFRAHSALRTLQMWPMVRRGEKRWIFPFQSEADATFNSALDYELAVLKPEVEQLLATVKSSDPEYAEARRLQAFLANFVPIHDRIVPLHSILREYIGGSSLQY
jgi:uridine kinase